MVSNNHITDGVSDNYAFVRILKRISITFIEKMNKDLKIILEILSIYLNEVQKLAYLFAIFLNLTELYFDFFFEKLE